MKRGRRGRRMRPATLPAGALVAAALAALASSAAAQTFQGRVVDEGSERGVSAALVRLLDPDGRDRALTLTDTLGGFRLVAPGPGTYRISAERLGFATVGSPLLAVEDPGGVYPVDVLMRPAPLPIAGVTVSVERRVELERAITRVLGVNPRSLRTPPIPRRVIEEHLARAHTLVDLVRWSNTPIVVLGSGRDTCFQYRQRCMAVYLNGVHLDPDFFDTLPLELLETVVVVGVNEAVQYKGPALLLYTAGWLR